MVRVIQGHWQCHHSICLWLPVPISLKAVSILYHFRDITSYLSNITFFFLSCSTRTTWRPHCGSLHWNISKTFGTRKQVLSSSWDGRVGDRLATMEMDRKLGAVPFLFFWGGGGAGFPCNTMYLGRALPSYQVASWSSQSIGHNKHGPKIGWGAVRRGGGAGSASNTMLLGPRPYLRTKWHLDPSNRLARINVGRKVGAVPPFSGGGGWVPI